MRLILTLLVRDEEDILAANLDYHFARGVDFAIVTDNRSVDATPAILERYRARGLVHVIHEPADDYAQGRWVTRMARLAAREFDADWVINGDADEFWWPHNGDLKTCLRQVPAAAGGVVVQRNNFVPDPHRDGPFHRRLVFRETDTRNHLGGALPPKVCHRADPDAIVGQGNHTVEGPRLGALVDDDRLEILHFPIRDFAQFERKIANGGSAYERNAELPADVGHVWRELYRAYRDGRLREEYDRLVPNAEGLRRGVATGDFVADTRLSLLLEGDGCDESGQGRG